MSVINTNIQAIAAARNLNQSQEMLGRSLSRLSSGSKIVNPSDDAAGLAVSEKLDAQGRRVKEGEQVVIGGNERYRSVCPACFYSDDDTGLLAPGLFA